MKCFDKLDCHSALHPATLRITDGLNVLIGYMGQVQTIFDSIKASPSTLSRSKARLMFKLGLREKKGEASGLAKDPLGSWKPAFQSDL